MVWLHGWGQDHQSLMKLAKMVGHQGPHLLFDQPGFGQTEMLHKGAGTNEYAAALLEQLDHLNIASPVILVGHSFGCRVSVQLAAMAPDRVAKVIMIAGAGLKRQRSLIWHLKAQRLKFKSRLAKLFDTLFGTEKLAEFRGKYGSADYKAAGALRETFVTVVNEDLTNQAQQISCDALMIYGSEDQETPPEFGQRYSSLIAKGRYVECAGLGHLDILDRGAYQVTAYINDFMKDGVS